MENFISHLHTDQAKNKMDYIQEFYTTAKKLFPNKKIKFVADGLFTTVQILTWCSTNGVDADFRMHSNRKVLYKGKMQSISQIPKLKPVGRQMARTIKIIWHDLHLYLTAERRIDKHNNESIVYLASTYYAKPYQHVAAYKKRWPIEKIFRTAKQHVGIQECFSRKLKIQENHICAVFLAYSIAQLEMKNRKHATPEAALRAIKLKNRYQLNQLYVRLDQIFEAVYA